MAEITTSDPPQMYAVRLVKNGPRCACKVWYGAPADPVTGELLDRSPRWQVQINGQHVDTDGILILVGDVGYVKGDRITAEEYQYLISVSEWAQSVPDAPEHEPRKPIDLNKMKPIF